MRAIATTPSARGLMDDAAVLDINGTTLVLTHDALIEGVHFLPSDPPQSVAWKLVAVNASDLAAKGATPLGVLFSHTLTGDPSWDIAFADGLDTALKAHGAALLGGDTVKGQERHLGLSMIGTATGPVPVRSGAASGDHLYLTGPIGNAGAGLSMLKGDRTPQRDLIAAYQWPEAQMAIGQHIAPLVSAMMDVSDGLLLDALRMAEASGLSVTIDLAQLPLSGAYVSSVGDDRAARLFAATAGDDYVLLCATNPAQEGSLREATEGHGSRLAPIGHFAEGHGLTLLDQGIEVPIPSRLGYLHGE